LLSPVVNVPMEGAVISVHIAPKRRDRSPCDKATHPVRPKASPTPLAVYCWV